MELPEDKNFHSLMSEHAKQIIKYLIQKSITFSILCNVKKIQFNPLLPILKELPELSFFVLVGYTFESIEIRENILCFEAGFGQDNEGSFVDVPFDSIVQITLCTSQESLQSNIPEEILFINRLASFDAPPPLSEEINIQNSQGIQNSMQAFLQNPENQHLKNNSQKEMPYECKN